MTENPYKPPLSSSDDIQEKFQRSWTIATINIIMIVILVFGVISGLLDDHISNDDNAHWKFGVVIFFTIVFITPFLTAISSALKPTAHKLLITYWGNITFIALTSILYLWIGLSENNFPFMAAISYLIVMLAVPITNTFCAKRDLINSRNRIQH